MGKSNFCDVRTAIFTILTMFTMFTMFIEFVSAVYDTPARSAQLQCLFRQVMRPFIVTG